MHLKCVTIHPERFPTREHYPFNLGLLQNTRAIEFTSPVTFFVGENGTGKSTLLKAICRKCGIHIWEPEGGRRVVVNLYEDTLHRAVEAEWTAGGAPGAFFGSDTFGHFTQALEEWAAADPGQLEYFGGKSLVTQSHGQSILAFFRARYTLPGLYLMDEPETALSARSQIELARLLRDMGAAGHAQFIVATHSPILMACPGARIYSFDAPVATPIKYEDTEHFKLYHAFMRDPAAYLGRA